MNILITGISGFVGVNACVYFKGKDELKIYGHARNVQAAARTTGLPLDRFVHTIDAEVLNMANIDAIIHLAGLAHDLSGKYTETDYFEVNTRLTQTIYDAFLASDAHTFIYLSSIKALADWADEVLTEDQHPRPTTPYGRSKRQAEEYILQNERQGKLSYILRPCLIHGPGNKGNLNLLYQLVSRGIPYPFGAFDNLRSFLYIENLMHVIHRLLTKPIPTGLYHVADGDDISTVGMVRLMAHYLNKSPRILPLPKSLMQSLSTVGDWLHLPVNSSMLHKLTENYQVSNAKLLAALGENLPYSLQNGLEKTFASFNASS
jgi:nucleoside-diphosphate-sugar epimerase